MEKYKKGAFFTVSERAMRMLTQLLVVTSLARHLGPQELGSFLFCHAIVTLFGFLNNLGLETLLIKYLIDFKERQFFILKHALILRLFTGLLCVFLSNVIGFFLVEKESQSILFFVSLLHLFTPFNVFSSLFQVRGRSDLSSIGLMIGNIVGATYAAICIFFDFRLVFISFYFILDAFACALIYYSIVNKEVRWSFKKSGKTSFEELVSLFRRSLPLTLTGAVTLLYMKVDQIMIGHIDSLDQVGLYVAATRLSEAWYFIGLSLVGVFYPKVLIIKEKFGEEEYINFISYYGRLLIWGAIALAFLTTIMSSIVIETFYGDAYLGASTILSISIWAVPFVYLGGISSKMYIIDNKQNLIVKRGLLGLIVNIGLNLLLIPDFGAVGAAVSTLFSQFCVGFLFNFTSGMPSLVNVQLSMFFLTKSIYSKKNK